MSTNMLSKEEANELFSWIDNLEIALESLQRGVVDLFATNDSCARRTLLEQVISQRQIWLERPVDELQKLIAIGKEKNICLNTTN